MDVIFFIYDGNYTKFPFFGKMIVVIKRTSQNPTINVELTALSGI